VRALLLRPDMTPLKREILDLVRQEGPISIARYMGLCLSHPLHGYYMTRDPFGATGDFITAPETSQMFGELIGLWAGEVWRMMGAPTVSLIELGPGRGTLMADALRAARAVPGFADAMSVHLVEMSPVLRERQRVALTASDWAKPTWHSDVTQALACANGTAPDVPCILIANEFLDALPLRQFVHQSGKWHERLVGLDADGADLAFGLNAEPARGISGAAPEGTVLEHPAEALALVTSISRHVAAHGGAALFIDYGSIAGGFGDTLQAMRKHEFSAVLDAPGEDDLTVHVDFARMSDAALNAGAATHGPVEQGAFLAALGLAERAIALSRKAGVEQAEALASAVTRLAGPGPDGMGELFKVLAVADPRLPLLPGFDAIHPPEVS
jgi:NADH dehydrogenase [ubiquinone] 1 alpha subcomplex assembly factor 7